MCKLAHVQWQHDYLGVHPRHPVERSDNLTLIKTARSVFPVCKQIQSPIPMQPPPHRRSVADVCLGRCRAVRQGHASVLLSTPVWMQLIWCGCLGWSALEIGAQLYLGKQSYPHPACARQLFSVTVLDAVGTFLPHLDCRDSQMSVQAVA